MAKPLKPKSFQDLY